MNATPSSTQPSGRALVIGGGGSVGNAWAIGVVAGLYEAGLDVTHADLTVGTSSGSTAAAQITSGASPADLLSAILAAQPDRPRAPIGPASDHLDRTAVIIAASAHPADMRRRMGAAAMATDEASGSTPSRWRSMVAARLPNQGWPRRLLLIPAVDADTGEPVVFDRDSGVDLVDAIAASTSNGFGIPPYEINGHRYINGGYRRNENADLAVGCARVVVLSPFGGRSRYPTSWRMQLSVQVEELEAAGSRVEVIAPASESTHMFDANAMDLSLRPPAARAGYEQGLDLAGRLLAAYEG